MLKLNDDVGEYASASFHDSVCVSLLVGISSDVGITVGRHMMATDKAVTLWLVVLVFTSSVTRAYHVRSSDDVSQLARYDVNSRSHAPSSLDADREGVMKRTPGWGKRRHDIMSQYAQSKRRGWGKRDTNKCGYWKSLLQFVDVGADHLLSHSAS